MPASPIHAPVVSPALHLCDRSRLEAVLDHLQFLSTQLDVLGPVARATLAEMVGSVPPATPGTAAARLEAAARTVHGMLDDRKAAGLRAVCDEATAICRILAAMTADGHDRLTDAFVAGRRDRIRAHPAEAAVDALFSAVAGLVRLQAAA